MSSDSRKKEQLILAYLFFQEKGQGVVITAASALPVLLSFACKTLNVGHETENRQGLAFACGSCYKNDCVIGGIVWYNEGCYFQVKVLKSLLLMVKKAFLFSVCSINLLPLNIFLDWMGLAVTVMMVWSHVLFCLITAEDHMPTFQDRTTGLM